ncbi:DNA-directed DNA polymerase [Dorcoceras hygrometricum]|uniref:DNA polymerase delta subunit 3 n=1 Tax=Dorcoceras hygrometricum TaxID=472368 RepID=A0A2Z7B7I4_9LAMI|nr:DNA-directed DNA polymerase [Dorcoceras hygrometricum]
MTEIETLGILDEVRSIVSDKLQVVSYKWLSRNFLVSSNAAKRLLQDFVDKHGSELEVVFSLSGWLKDKPYTYHIKLVSKHNLTEAKQEFEGHCSVHVYSVQACLPKDPVTLWNHEFVQAEDFFKQPLADDNCLRDNRFSGVSNSFVKRNAGKTPLASAFMQSKAAEISGLSASYSSHGTMEVPRPQQKKVRQSSSNVGIPSPSIVYNVKSGSNVKLDPEQDPQLAANEEKAPQQLSKKKKDQNDKSSSGMVGSLASMWGRASANSIPDVTLAQANNSKQKTAASADAQICAREAEEHADSDDNCQDFNVKRTSNGEGNRKRRVVFDMSDEDEFQDTISLASPDPSKKFTLGSKQGSNVSGMECNLSFEEKGNEATINEVREGDVKPKQLVGDKSIVKGEKDESSISEKTLSHVRGADASMGDKEADAGSKRRKVLRTRIDERGREVTEVVWEVDEPASKCNDNSLKKEGNDAVNNSTDRPLVARKSPSVGGNAPVNQAGKGGNKKAANKDPKQGNILSFFKKA